MFVLDTDHMSLLQRGGAEGQRIWQHIRVHPPDDLATTIISFEEQTRGWLARIAQATTMQRQIADYGELKQLLQDYCNIAVLAYDVRAVAEFEHLRQLKIRVGTMDLKIAAIALVNSATLVTRNLSDFGKVSGLKTDDWSF